MSETYATIEQGTTQWLARILEQGKEPYYFVPPIHAYIQTKGDLVRVVNRAYPGVTYVSVELFNTKAREAEYAS